MKISVLVKIGSKGEWVKKVGSTYEVRVKTKPVEGRANQAVIGLLSEFFDVSKNLMKIKSGLKSKKKIVEILQ